MSLRSSVNEEAAKPRNWMFAGVVDLTLGFANALLFTGVFFDISTARTIANIAQDWPPSEFVATFTAPFLTWAFLREERTPAWQRAITLPFVIVTIGGLSAFVVFLRFFWFYLLAKCFPYLLRRPTQQEHDDGLVRSMIGIPWIVILAGLFLNRPTEPVFGIMAGPEIPGTLRYTANMMLFGAIYFIPVGLATTLWAYVMRYAEEGPST